MSLVTSLDNENSFRKKRENDEKETLNCFRVDTNAKGQRIERVEKGDEQRIDQFVLR